MFDTRPLLAAVRDALRQGLSGVRPADVYLTGHEGHIPEGVRLPCVGVKDGAVRRSELAGNVVAATVRVRLAVYAPLGRIGSENTEVLALASAVHQVLDDNTLGLLGVLNAFSPEEGEADWFGGPDGDALGVLLRKVITYEYDTEESRL